MFPVIDYTLEHRIQRKKVATYHTMEHRIQRERACPCSWQPPRSSFRPKSKKKLLKPVSKTVLGGLIFNGNDGADVPLFSSRLQNECYLRPLS